MMKMILIIIGWLIIFPSQIAFASSIEKKMGIGFNYPGLSLKYGINSKNTIEIKTQLGKDILAVGPRYYRNFSTKDRLVLFFGGEADSLRFTGRVSKGSGIAFLTFIGCEYLTSPNLGISLDIGPAYISLKDKDTAEREKGIDFVLNIGLTYYFGGDR